MADESQERVTDLPAWAQRLIADLRNQAKQYRQKARQLEAQLGQQQTRPNK